RRRADSLRRSVGGGDRRLAATAKPRCGGQGRLLRCGNRLNSATPREFRRLPYIPSAQIIRITDATFAEAKCRPKKVKSFARLASKPSAIRGNSYWNQTGRQTSSIMKTLLIACLCSLALALTSLAQSPAPHAPPQQSPPAPPPGAPAPAVSPGAMANPAAPAQLPSANLPPGAPAAPAPPGPAA